MRNRATSVIVRSTYGTAAVEWFLIIAIATILITRLYLQLTGYPQVGGGTLHIAGEILEHCGVENDASGQCK